METPREEVLSLNERRRRPRRTRPAMERGRPHRRRLRRGTTRAPTDRVRPSGWPRPRTRSARSRNVRGSPSEDAQHLKAVLILWFVAATGLLHVDASPARTHKAAPNPGITAVPFPSP